jgi:ABC-type transport system involved in multi-copper enzyme maturation permease subunit
MMSEPAYRSTVSTARDGFAQILRAEWTKLRSVRSTVGCLIALVVLMLAITVLVSTASRTDANTGPQYDDSFTFVHRQLTGDGTIVARVPSQRDSHEWAKAGVVVKAGAAAGSPYAAVMVTPGHGVRMQATFDTDIAGGAGSAPRWLKLTRVGDVITGYESADGATWRTVGAVTVALPPAIEAGLFVSSPAALRVTKVVGGMSVTGEPTEGAATFNNVSVEAVAPQAPARWRQQVIGAKATPGDQDTDGKAPPAGDPGQAGEAGGTFTISGSGDIAGYGIPGFQGGGDDDIVVNSLGGVQLGLLAAVALGVLFAAGEYRTGMIRTTFTTSPRRGRVLVAKAIVVGSAVFGVGLLASVGGFLLAQPVLHRHGYRPPAYPYATLADGSVLRAIVGTALFLAVLAVFSLAAGAILRRPARAITMVVALVLVPQIVASLIPSLAVDKWINRVTPIAGLAVQQTRQRFDVAIGPWGGLAVLCAYAAVTMAVAIWLLRRRDA